MAVVWKKVAYETDVIAKSLLTAKGDIIYASDVGTPVALAIGNDNDVLTVSTDVPGWEAMAALSTHKDTHDPEDGSDPLDTAAPAELAGVQTSGEGSSHSFARADHVHQIQESFADNHIVTINSATIAENNMARFTATGGLDGLTYAELAELMALDDIGDPDAAVGFNGQQAEDLVVHTVADADSRPDAVVGKACYQTDESAIYVCTSAV